MEENNVLRDYTLIRSYRKTLAIYVTNDAQLQVRAPLKMKKSEIDKCLHSKEKWISSKLNEKAQQLKEKASFTLNYGDTALMLGNEHMIQAKSGSNIGFDESGFYMPPGFTCAEIKRALIQIYKTIAKKIIVNKAIQFAQVMRVSPSSVRVNSAKTRWGSCSSKNSINFSWRLILACDDVIDYVVVHELAHIVEHNHSAAFWAVVASVLPDYASRRQGLNALQERLLNENWE